MSLRRQQYRSYLLRLWRIRTSHGYTWRATLQDTRTRQTQGFPDLAALAEYLLHLEDAHAGGMLETLDTEERQPTDEP